MQIDILQTNVQRGWSWQDIGAHLHLDYAPTGQQTGHYNDRHYDMDTTLIGRVEIPDLDYIYQGDAIILAERVYVVRLSQDGKALLLADEYCGRGEYDFAFPIQQVTV